LTRELVRRARAQPHRPRRLWRIGENGASTATAAMLGVESVDVFAASCLCCVPVEACAQAVEAWLADNGTAEAFLDVPALFAVSMAEAFVRVSTSALTRVVCLDRAWSRARAEGRTSFFQTQLFAWANRIVEPPAPISGSVPVLSL
jgi:hypothetical protein